MAMRYSPASFFPSLSPSVQSLGSLFGLYKGFEGKSYVSFWPEGPSWWEVSLSS